MYITDNLKSFLKDSSLTSGNSFYITDTKDVKYFASNTISTNINEPINKILLKKICEFEENNKLFYFLFNGKEHILPIMQEEQDIPWTAQIILPIYRENKLIGTVIMISTYKTFNTKHLEYAQNTRHFVEELL